MIKENFYIVGGYVRDTLLGKTPSDIDYCVVGETPESMINQGFQKVGADFPVFLDKNGDEYALARTEKKQGIGHKGFEVVFDKTISLKQDMERRDLTINAMAFDKNNKVIDYFSGQKDLKDKFIRHINENFRDDPLRVLRVARFYILIIN